MRRIEAPRPVPDWDALPGSVWHDVLDRCDAGAAIRLSLAGTPWAERVGRLRPELMQDLLRRRLAATPAADLPQLLRGRHARIALRTMGTVEVRSRVLHARQAAGLLAGLRGVPEVRLALDGSIRRAHHLVTALARPEPCASLRHLSLSNTWMSGRTAARLLGCAALAPLESLDLSENRLGEAGPRALVRATHMRCLQALNLEATGLDLENLGWLANAAHLASLTSLDLRQYAGGGLDVAGLVAATQLSRLRQLHLTTPESEATGPAELLAAPHLRGLAALPWIPAGAPNGAAGRALLGLLARASHLTELTLCPMTDGDARLTPPDARALAEMPHLAGLRTLCIIGSRLGRAGAVALARAPFWGGLTDLTAGREGFGAGPLARLLAAPSLTQLARLVLCHGANSPCAALAAATQLTKLTALRLCCTGREGCDDLAWLAEASHLRSLRSLAIVGVYWCDLPAWALAGATALTGLARLELGVGRVTQRAARALRGAAHLASVRTLEIVCEQDFQASAAVLRLGRLGASLARLEVWSDGRRRPRAAPAIVAALAWGTPLPGLTDLDLRHVDLDDVDLWTLAQGHACPNLRQLEVCSSRLTDVSLGALAAGSGLQRLRELRAYSDAFTARGVEALGHARHLRALEVLRLHRLELDDAAATAILQGHGLPSLVGLDCDDRRLTRTVRRRLRSRFG